MSIEVDGVKIVPTIFPDKTSQVWKLPEDLLQKLYKASVAMIHWEFESEAEIIQVAQLKTLLDTYCQSVSLEIPYLVYGRQDKRIDNNSTFALHTFAKIINALNFDRVVTIDAHEKARAGMIERLEDIKPRHFIMDTAAVTNADLLLFPDAGAATRYGCLGLMRPFIYADKVREQSTGLIKEITLNGSVKGKKILIVDDICDGGMTFIMVAKQALKNKAKEVNLYVTHGIFSKGLAPLKEAGIKRIFTHKGEINETN